MGLLPLRVAIGLATVVLDQWQKLYNADLLTEARR
jgi:hypothetical protein